MTIVDIRRARLREFAERWPDPAAVVARGTRATVESLRPRMAVDEELERITSVGPLILPQPPASRSRLLALAIALSLALWAAVGTVIWLR